MSGFRERFVGWLAQLDQTQREVLLASLLLVVVLLAGTVGYILIEGWTWMDGLYMTFITVTTIGFTEVHAPLDGGSHSHDIGSDLRHWERRLRCSPIGTTAACQ